MHVLLFPLCEESIVVDFCLFCIITYYKRFCRSVSLVLSLQFLFLEVITLTDQFDIVITLTDQFDIFTYLDLASVFLSSYNNQCHFFLDVCPVLCLSGMT